MGEAAIIDVKRVKFGPRWDVFRRFGVRMGEILGCFGGLPQVLQAPTQEIRGTFHLIVLLKGAIPIPMDETQ